MGKTGTVKRWLEGYGFISIAGTGDVFVHHTDISDPGATALPIGARVMFDLAPDKRTPGRFKAVNVSLIG